MVAAMIFTILNEVVWNLKFVSLLVVIDGVYKDSITKMIISGVDILITISIELYWLK